MHSLFKLQHNKGGVSLLFNPLSLFLFTSVHNVSQMVVFTMCAVCVTLVPSFRNSNINVKMF